MVDEQSFELHAPARNSSMAQLTSHSAILTRGWGRLASLTTWVVSAVTALVTTRILLDTSYHYPMRILFLQIVAASTCWIACFLMAFFRITSIPIRFNFWFCKPGIRLSYYSPSNRTMGAALCMASSMLLFMQAALHLPDLVGLLMLSTFTTVSDTMTSYFCSSSSKRSRARLEAILLGSACLIILYEEYKLTVNGLVFGLLAMSSAGLSKAFHRDDCRLARQQRTPVSLHSQWCTFLTATLTFGMAISGFCTFTMESTTVNNILPTGQGKLVALNLTASAIAITSGGSFFTFLDRADNETELSAEVDLFLTGFTGCSVWQFGNPSCSSMWQILSYVAVSLYQARNVWPDPSPTEFLPLGDPAIHSSLPKTGLSPPDVEGDDHGLSHMFDQQTINQNKSGYVWRRCSLLQWMKFGMAGLLVGCWIRLAILSVRCQIPAPDYQIPKEHLDISYQPATELDIVISMYKESAESVRKTMDKLNGIPMIAANEPRLLLYVKNQEVDLAALKDATGASEVIRLPNIGREGETYLRHIVTRWDNLAKHTIFLQAGLHNSWEIFRRLETYLNTQTGMLSLGFSGNLCKCDDCEDRWGWSEDPVIIQQIYYKIFNQTCTGSILLPYKGQFVASAKRIRGAGLSIYEELLELIANQPSWAHQPSYLRGRPDSLNAPWFGYTLERLWSVILQCNNLKIALKCPTLLSGRRRFGDVEDCQCMDIN